MLPRSFAILLLGVALSVPAAKPPAATPAPTEIILRHALSGENAARLIELVDRYNQETKSGKVMLQHVDAAPDRHLLPHLALLEENDYQKFFDSHPRMLPLYRVMNSAQVRFDEKSLFPVLADVVSDNKGRIQSLPLAYSVPMLYFNKETFRKAHLDPAKPPLTWWQLQTAAGKIYDIDRRCPFTSSNPAWVLLENTATQHGGPISVSDRGGKTELQLNNLVEVKHVALLSSWHKSFYFRTFGAGREADVKFLSGECAMLTSDSSLYLQLLKRQPFDFGVAALPYYDDVYGAAPGHLMPDGAALWVVAGKKKPEYLSVAHFIAYLMRPEIQKQWVGSTGYLPMTAGAMDALAAQGAPPELLRKAVERLSDKGSPSAAKPKKMLGMGRVRAILNEELEAVWANLKPSKEALDTAVRRGDSELQALPADTPGN